MTGPAVKDRRAVTCHRAKTARDVAEKSAVAAKRTKQVAGRRKRSRFATARGGAWKALVGGGAVRRDANHDE